MEKLGKESLSHCGYRCDLCPALWATQKNDLEALSKLSKEWERLFGFHLEPEELRCDGCTNNSGRRVDKNCPVRPCCIRKGLQTCAECADYPCDALEKRFVNRGDVEKILGHAIPENTYRMYVMPFESRARLDEIREQRVR